MKVKEALTVLKTNNTKDNIHGKVCRLLESHGFSNHEDDVSLFFLSFVNDEESFTDKTNMPQEWKSHRAIASAFDALFKCIHIDAMTAYLIESIGTDQYNLLSQKFDALKKHYNNLAKKDKPQKKDEEISVVTTPLEPIPEDHSPSQEDEETDLSETDQEDEEISDDDTEEKEYTTEDICRLEKKVDLCMGYIWQLYLAESDPFRKITLKTLHDALEAI
jgi:hypothetical protein